MLKPQRMDLPQSLIIHSTKKHSCGFSFSLTFQTAFHLAAQQTGSTSERRQCLVKAKVGKHIVRQQSKSYNFLRNRLKEISSLFLQRYETCMKSLDKKGWKKFPISFGTIQSMKSLKSKVERNFQSRDELLQILFKSSKILLISFYMLIIYVLKTVDKKFKEFFRLKKKLKCSVLIKRNLD